MKREKISEALGKLDGDLIDRAVTRSSEPKARTFPWGAVAAAAACLTLVLAAMPFIKGATAGGESTPEPAPVLVTLPISQFADPEGDSSGATVAEPIVVPAINEAGEQLVGITFCDSEAFFAARFEEECGYDPYEYLDEERYQSRTLPKLLKRDLTDDERRLLRDNQNIRNGLSDEEKRLLNEKYREFLEKWRQVRRNFREKMREKYLSNKEKVVWEDTALTSFRYASDEEIAQMKQDSGVKRVFLWNEFDRLPISSSADPE